MAAESAKAKNQKEMTTVATSPARRVGGSTCGVSSKSHLEINTLDLIASISARLGGLVLLDKEAYGLDFGEYVQAKPMPSRWSAVGKVCSSRPLKRLVHVGGVCEPPLNSTDEWGSIACISGKKLIRDGEGSTSSVVSNKNSFHSSQDGNGSRAQ
ncbi:hypothetical protein D1007_16781 [Hordeum vulgare]|nr:hypothetical protein D1007_16781 [Hordeum vulgare]